MGFIGVLMLGLLFLGCLTQQKAQPEIASPDQISKVEQLENLGPAPDFKLTNQDRQEIALSDLRGKVVLISFIYTNCPDFCPAHTARMSQIQRALGTRSGKDVYLVSITFDPGNDTPEVLKTYSQKFKADLSGWAFLTGTPEEIEPVLEDYRITAVKDPKSELFEHNSWTLLVDSRGMRRKRYFGLMWENEQILVDIESLLAENL